VVAARAQVSARPPSARPGPGGPAHQRNRRQQPARAIDGIIQLRLAEPGEVLGAGGRVLLLIDPSDQYMNLYLPASVTGALTVGDEARILLDALPDQPLPAKISFVAAKSQFTPKKWKPATSAKAGVPRQTAPDPTQRRAPGQTGHARRRLCAHG
jgi:HlyD family secretion protein